MTYTRASQGGRPPKAYQTTDYPAYIGKILSAKARLRSCLLSLPELANLIERTELDIRAGTAQFNKNEPKEFRHNFPAERKQVVMEIRTAWEQVKSLANPVETMLHESFADAALAMCGAFPINGYDLFILETLKRSGSLQIITDDGDFAVVPGITVFTSNHNVIKSAQAQGKLITR